VKERSPASFRWLIVVTCAVTYALVVLGGIVRVTGSGDACPDWPRCHGQLLPPLEGDVLIEFSHRLVASVVGFLVLGVAVLGWRARGRLPSLVPWGAFLAVGLVGGQVVLGGMTVLNDLDADLVTAHLALASTLLATLVVLALASFDLTAPASGATGGASFRNLAVVAALATFALMLSGSYVAGSGASLAFRDWPLFDGQLLPEGGHRAMAHGVHRLAAAGVGVLLIYMTVRAWRAGGRTPIALLATAALVLYVAQVFVGAANIWTLIQPATRGAHLALAVAVWGLLVALAVLAHVAVGQPGPTEVVSRQPRIVEPRRPEPAEREAAAAGRST
jgi:protoheme IX farnesyltransferase